MSDVKSGQFATHRRGVWLGAASAAALLASGAAQAQTAQETTLGEVVVTATKRAESIQDVPQSVTAISAETLVTSGASEFSDYATTVPNLSFGYAGEGRQTSRQFQLRGIFGRDTSALYIGETAVPVTIDPRVIDLDRVEVLRGPQGSLFGSRSMGGLVRLIPTAPGAEQEVKLHATVANVEKGGQDYALDGTMNVPISDKAAFRATAYILKDAGYIDRIIDPNGSLLIRPLATSVVFPNGDERVHDDINKDTTYGIQAALRLKPTDALTLTPRVMYQKLKSDSPNLADSSVTNLAKIRQFDVDEIGRDTWWLAALEADLDVGVGTVTSSTSYFHRDTRDDEDATIFIASNLLAGRVRVALSAPSVTTEVSEQKRFAEEIRFVSKFEGRLQVIAGAFFQNIEEDGGFPATGSIIPGNSPLVTSPGLAAVGFRAGDNFFSLDTRTEQREFGLFGEVEYDLTEQLTATLGGRFFDLKADQYRADGGTLFTKFYRVFAGFPPPAPYSNSTKENGFNPKAAIRWEPSQDLTIYATAAKGFRPGQVNASKGACQALGVANVPDSVDSDSLWNYELGAKASLAGGRVTANAAVFHIDWKDRQTQTINCGLGFGASTNVGKVESEGFDAEVAFEPIDNLRFTGAVGYSDAKVTNTGGAAGVTLGDRLPNVPKWNGAAAVDYSHEFTDSIEGYGRIDYRYVGASISTLRRVRPAYELVNARLGVRYGDWDVSLFAQNLFDERANLADITPLSDSLQLVGVSRPRTIGLDLRTRF